MQIGKREQIVISGIVTIVVVGLMHFLIFDRAQRDFKKARDTFNEKVASITSLSTIKNKAELTSFTRQTEQLINELTSGTRILQLEQPAAFLPFDPAKVAKVTIPPGTPEALAADLQNAANGRAYVRYLVDQTTTMLEQVSLLQQHITAKAPLMTFMGPRGWNVPTALPPAMQTGYLWDTLREIEDSRNTLNTLQPSTGDYQRIQQQYYQNLAKLGLSVQVAEALKRYGEFVPLYYRLGFVELILKQIPKDHPIIIHNEELSLQRVLDMLQVNAPYAPLTGMTDSQFYIAFEYLRELNRLLDQATELQLTEVNDVTLFAYGYLRQQPTGFTMADVTVTDPKLLPFDEQWRGGLGAAVPTPGVGLGMGAPDDSGAATAPLNGMAPVESTGGGVLTGAPTASFTPTPDIEIGLALPIRLTFRADNMRSWNFMYGVLRKQPLVEMNRLELKSLSLQDPNNQNIEATVTYIAVPKLFQTIDTVNAVLQQIHGAVTPAPGGGAAAAAPPGGAPPTATPAAATPAP